MILHGGKQSFIERIGQYNQTLFDNMWSEHMLKVKKHVFSRFSCVEMPLSINCLSIIIPMEQKLKNKNEKMEMVELVFPTKHQIQILEYKC